MRVGLGSDVHRLEAGLPLIIGGVTIPHESGCVGHSDADVLLHALTDALLGAAGLGDIGDWFPDTDPQWKGADSVTFVNAAYAAVTAAGWTIENLDCIVSAQRPKLSPYKQTIRNRIAEVLQIEPERINVKAKTGERVGPIGREEAIAAQVVVLLSKE